MYTATKTGIDAAKTPSKKVVQKAAEATGDWIGNEIADKITSVGKSKEETNKTEEIYILPEKRQHIIDDLKLFWIIIIIIIIIIITIIAIIIVITIIIIILIITIITIIIIIIIMTIITIITIIIVIKNKT